MKFNELLSAYYTFTEIYLVTYVNITTNDKEYRIITFLVVMTQLIDNGILVLLNRLLFKTFTYYSIIQ